jgi:hypothetical protein
MVTEYAWNWVRDGYEKTELVRARVYEGAIQPAVRDVAVRLVAGTDRNAHHERLARLHRFVRDSIDYHREPVEILQSATLTLERGGDCDDLVILLGALAWSLRYPWIVEPVGDPRDPHHYSLLLGWPPSDSPHGDATTRWVQTEPSVAAAFGETPEAAAERGAML